MLSLESNVKYIPEFRGERKRYEKGENEHPLIFHIKVMGALPFRNFAAKLSAAMDGDKVNSEVFDLYREVMKKHVIQIENLTVDGAPIVTGSAFYDHPSMPNALVSEIEATVVDVNRLFEDDEKN